MITVDQWRVLMHDIAELKRQNGTSEREGTVHKVWHKDGEQKIRVQMGYTPDGQPLLSPWLHTEDHRGPHREENKYRKGQSVKISTTGGDFRAAKVTPGGENQGHQRPRHAKSYASTWQDAHLRKEDGSDYSEVWLSKKLEKKDDQQQQQNTQEANKDTSSQQKMKEEEKDDVSKAVALQRFGKRQKDRKEQTEPWDGPDVIDGDPKGIHTTWAKKASSGGGGGAQAGAGDDDGPPDVEEERVHVQFGKKSRHAIGEEKITHSIGELDKKGELTEEAKAVITTLLKDKMTHQVTDKSIITVLKDLVQNKVEGSSSSVKPNDITHSSQSVQNLGGSKVVNSAPSLHLHGSPILATPMTIHGGSHSASSARRLGLLTLSSPITTLDILDGVTVSGTTTKTITEDASLGWHSAGHLLSRGPGNYRFTFDVKFIGLSSRSLQWWWADADNWADDSYILVINPDGTYAQPDLGLGEDFFTVFNEDGEPSVVISTVDDEGFYSVQFDVRIATGFYANMQAAFELDLSEARAQYQGLNNSSGIQIRNYTIERLADRTFVSAAISAADPPHDPENFIPNNGMRWIDTNSGIEYAYYNGVWSEGGGDIIFPAAPALNDLFNYQGRQWKWNSKGWESTLTARATAVEGRAGTLEGRATALENRATLLEARATAVESRCTSLEARVTVLETTIDGGTF